MRAMQTLVVVMGVLIVAGVAVIAVTIVGRMSPGAKLGARVGADTVLDEPPGTRILGASTNGRQVAMVLQGGGPDRVAVIDLETGRRIARVSLAH